MSSASRFSPHPGAIHTAALCRSAATSSKVRPSPSRVACLSVSACHLFTTTSTNFGSSSIPKQTRSVISAAEITERVCFGMELDPKFVDVVVKRWQALTDKQATLDGDGRTFDEVAAERQRAAV